MNAGVPYARASSGMGRPAICVITFCMPPIVAHLAAIGQPPRFVTRFTPVGHCSVQRRRGHPPTAGVRATAPNLLSEQYIGLDLQPPKDNHMETLELTRE